MRRGTIIDVVAVAALGLAAGAMLTEGALLAPYWRTLPTQEFLAWYAANASRLVAFYGPLEVFAAVATALAASTAAYHRRPARDLLLVATACAVAVLVAFPLYFRDANAAFAAGSIDAERVPQELGRWARYHWIRTGIGVIGFAAAVLAVCRSED